MDGAFWLDAAALLARELSLFAAAGFLLLGASDLAIDCIWIGLRLRRLLRPEPAAIPPAARPGRLAIFIPAWAEADVIGPMLRHARAGWGEGDYRIYVGCYPNDEGTIGAVAALADPHVRSVIGAAHGPTTKADCLNTIWTAMLQDEAAEGQRFKAIVLHDAEDVVHSAELRLFDAFIETSDAVQVPVLPLLDPQSRWVAGHYADEFAEPTSASSGYRFAMA
jgi:bacteriophage N4 adsorption protein B